MERVTTDAHPFLQVYGNHPRGTVSDEHIDGTHPFCCEENVSKIHHFCETRKCRRQEDNDSYSNLKGRVKWIGYECEITIVAAAV